MRALATDASWPGRVNCCSNERSAGPAAATPATARTIQSTTTSGLWSSTQRVSLVISFPLRCKSATWAVCSYGVRLSSPGEAELPTKRKPLSRERVLQTAVALADERGLDGLTMRKLAAELGVEAMSLYHHVAN